MSGRLAGKRIVITGAIANIRKEALRAFVAEGARAVLADITADAGAAVAAEFGPTAKLIHTDVTSEESVANLIQSSVDWLGGLDVLCQNAGLQHSGPIETFDAGRWDALFVVNSRAHFFGAKAKHAIPHLRRSGRGSIITPRRSRASAADRWLGRYPLQQSGDRFHGRTGGSKHQG